MHFKTDERQVLYFVNPHEMSSLVFSEKSKEIECRLLQSLLAALRVKKVLVSI